MTVARMSLLLAAFAQIIRHCILYGCAGDAVGDAVQSVRTYDACCQLCKCACSTNCACLVTEVLLCPPLALACGAVISNVTCCEKSNIVMQGGLQENGVWEGKLKAQSIMAAMRKPLNNLLRKCALLGLAYD